MDHSLLQEMEHLDSVEQFRLDRHSVLLTNDPNFVHRDSADLTINGGDLTINSDGDKIFSVENDGAVNIAGISNYFSQTVDVSGV